MGAIRYDWKELTKKFVKGAYKSVREFALWCEERRKNFNEDYPSQDSVFRMSKKLGWIDLKKRREDKMVENVVSQGIDKITKEQMEEMVKSKTAVNRALVNLIVHFAKNPSQLHVRADLSDLVNDAKRSMGMTTKEEQIKPALQVSNNQMNVDEDSFRNILEESNDAELVKIEEITDKDIEMIESRIPDNQLSFLEDDDDE